MNNSLNDIFFAPAENSSLTYEQILENVQRYFSENHASTIAGENGQERAAAVLKDLMAQYLARRRYALKGLTTEELCARLYEDMAGYSFLKKWIYAPGVEEVNINAYNDIEVIMNSGRSIKIPDKFSSPQHAIDVVRRMLNACGMVIDDTMPSVIGFLDRNIRISVDKTPIVDADVGINASIRIVNQQTVSEEKLLESGSATAEMLHFLTACIRYGVSVCIAGSTGSGKTTIMAWLLSNVPDNRRLITIEEGSREFDLVKRDADGNILNSVVHLLTRPHENPSMNINQDFLLERVLRKHPDVIGVGEMRSAAESLSAAESSRTGHTVCTTIHSNSCESTYRRMMTLAKRKYAMDDSVLMQIMVEAYPVVVFTKQLEDRSRKIMEIIEGEDYRDGKLVCRSLYKYQVEDNTTDGDGNIHVAGSHHKMEAISDTLRKRLLDNGIPGKELQEFLQADPEKKSATVRKNAAKKAASSKKADTKTTDTKATGTKATDTKTADTKNTGTKATSSKATDTKATGSKATGTKATSSKATDTKTMDTKATGTKATGSKAAASKSAATKTACIKAVDVTAEEESSDGKAAKAEYIPAENSAANTSDANTANAKDNTAGMTDTEAACSKGTDAKPAAADTTATDAKAAAAKPAKSKSTAAKPVKQKSLQPEPADTESTGNVPGQENTVTAETSGSRPTTGRPMAPAAAPPGSTSRLKPDSRTLKKATSRKEAE